jgi:hypothetical protein
MRPRFSSIPKLIVLGVLPATLALTFAGNVLAGLVGGVLPAAGFTYTSVTDNDVNIGGDGVHLKTKGPVTIKTTYSKAAVGDAFLGPWHYHNGAVLVTVTVGTLTYYDSSCGTWDLTAGHTYIESTGEVLNAKALASKNPGLSGIEWFTTRLYPEGAADPAPVDAPCTP